MTKQSRDIIDSILMKSLRERAEQALRIGQTEIAKMPRQSVESLVYELQVYQSELEIQNEDLRQTQLRLAESLDRYSDLYHFAPVGYMTLDRESKILEANLAAAGLLGRERLTLIGVKLTRFIPSWDQDAFYRHRTAALCTESRQSCELCISREKDATHWVSLESIGYRDPAKGEPRINMALIDISERKRAEDEIRRLNEQLEQRVIERTAELTVAKDRLYASEQRLSAVLKTAADAIVTFDSSGFIRSANPAAALMFGFYEDDLVGCNMARLLPPTALGENGGNPPGHSRETPWTSSNGCHTTFARRRDGTLFPVEASISWIDSLDLFAGVIRDITERRELESKVLRMAEEQQRQIGHELHDTVQQELSGLTLLAQDLAEELSANSAPLAERARRIASGIAEANREIRSLARGLVPAEIEAGGLIAALTDLVARVRQDYAVECSFEQETAPTALNNMVSTQLYRIAHEAIHNAVKHAKAKEIRIYLTTERGQVVLAVIDDGCGIDEERGAKTGMGLQIMSYRASLIGAVLRVERRKEGGTTTSCIVMGTDGGANPTGDRSSRV